MSGSHQRHCMHCGKPESQWHVAGPDIYKQGYCCRGCAEDYLCTCLDFGDGPLPGRVRTLDFSHD